MTAVASAGAESSNFASDCAEDLIVVSKTEKNKIKRVKVETSAALVQPIRLED